MFMFALDGHVAILQELLETLMLEVSPATPSPLMPLRESSGVNINLSFLCRQPRTFSNVCSTTLLRNEYGA